MGLIARELEALPPACKKVCTLLLNEQLTSSEIAQRLGISPQNVDIQIGRAVKRLKTAFIRQKITLLAIIFISLF